MVMSFMGLSSQSLVSMMLTSQCLTMQPPHQLKTQDSTQYRLSYLEGKVESISEMFKILMEEKRRNDLLFTGVIAK